MRSDGGIADDRRGSWRERMLPALVLGALLLFALRGPLSGRLFYLRDVSQNHYPIRQYVTERLRAGDLPLWDPFHGGGTPLLANPNNLVLHPITALFFALPFDAAFTASIVLQIALLAAGGYLLARRIGASRQGSALSAAVLSLSGPAASLASLQNVLSAYAWVPLGVWLFLRGLEPGRRGTLAAAAAVVGVILIAAEPASLFAFLVLALLLAWGSPGADGRAAGRASILPLAAVLVLAAAVAAVQLLPARELLPLTPRAGGLPPGEALKWSLRPIRLLEMVAPGLLGDPTRLHPASWWGGWLFEGRYPFLLCLYTGLIPCALALIAMFGGGRDGGRRRGLGAVALLGLVLALGGNGIVYRSLFHAVPALAQIRYPERFVLVTLAAVALLAALGLDRLTRPEGPAARRAIVGVATAAGGAFVLVTLLAAVPPLGDRLLGSGLAVPAEVLDSELGPGLRGAMLRTGLWMFGEAAVLAFGAAWALRGASIGATRAVGWSIVVVSGLSLAMAAAPALSTADPGWMRSPSPLREEIARGLRAPRVHHGSRPKNLSVWGKTDELVWGHRFDRFTYALATGHLDGVPTIFDAATDRMDLRDSPEIGRRLPELPIEARARVLALAHAGYLLTHESIDHPDLEPGPVLDGFSQPPLRVYRVKNRVPRARFVRRAIAPPAQGDVLMRLADPGFDPLQSVIVEGADGDGIPGGAGDANRARVLIVEDEPEKLAIRVESQEPGHLVLADAFAPGWTAEVDGERAEIVRANGLFRAVRIGAGGGTVTMRYAPASVRIGGWISLAALVLAGAWGSRSWRRRR